MAQSTMIRLEDFRRLKPGQQPPQNTKSPLNSILVLARWQLRQTWRLLLVTGAGMLIAVVLVCAIPLYTQVSISAGLRHALETNPANVAITVHSEIANFDSKALQDIQQEISQMVQQGLGPVISARPVLSLQIPNLTINTNNFIRLIGTDENQAAKHVKLLQGRFPQATTPEVVEYVTTVETQRALHLQLNSTTMLPYPMTYDTDTGPQLIHTGLKLRLVGIIDSIDGNLQFWHGEKLESDSFSVGLALLTRYPLLVSNTSLTQALNDIVKQANQINLSPRFVTNPEVYWYYNFNFSQLDINHLSDTSDQLKGLLTSLHPDLPPFIFNTTTTGPLNVLLEYSDRVIVLQLPMLCLTFLVTALALFFVLLITDVLIERHVEAITLLRSRGASGRQVFGALLGQSTLMGAIAFVAGPLLAILLVILLSMITLDAHEREALQLITAHPLTVVQGLLGRDLLIIGIALVAMILAIWRVMSSNVLSAQRESARSTQRPFWIRFKLDILAAVIALVGFSISLYITSPGVLNLRTRTLILPVTSLVGTLALLTGCVLLFLRIFMPILRWGERMAARNRGAAPLLAMAQLARSPRQPLRVTLLFALAVAFAIFTQIFNATQTQRLADITTYQVGSDFSGTIPSVLSGEDLGSQQAFYREIKGITSATLGDRTQMTGGSNQSILVDLEAVDSSTYAHTFYWTAQESGNQSISALMSRLQKSYADAVKHNVIPAILDDLAAKSLNVTVGQQFALSDFHGPMSYVVLAIVHYLPTIYDSMDSAGTDSSISQGGVLVDFATYSDIAMAVNSNGVSATVAWLRADNSSADVANARKTLFSGLYTFVNGLDRQQLTSELAGDPLYATIIGILAIGAAIALLLGLAGNLIVSWLNVRRRRVHFAVLRALGCGPGQIARVLIWEQAIVYSTALVLGILLSILFSLNILPAFIFSPLVNSDTAEAFYVIQSVPPVQIVLPVLPLLYTMVGLILVCILAISMMQRIVSHPRLGQILRINEE